MTATPSKDLWLEIQLLFVSFPSVHSLLEVCNNKSSFPKKGLEEWNVPHVLPRRVPYGSDDPNSTAVAKMTTQWA